MIVGTLSAFRYLARSGNRVVAMLGLLVVTISLVGCSAPSFTPRDVYFDNRQDRGALTTVAVVALTDTEMGWLNSLGGPEQRSAALTPKLGAECEWSSRSRVVDLRAKDDHLLLPKGDPLWKSFQKSAASGKDPARWLTLIVLDTNWLPSATERAFGYYQGSPDELPEECVSVKFGWVTSSAQPGTLGVKCYTKDPTGQK